MKKGAFFLILIPMLLFSVNIVSAQERPFLYTLTLPNSLEPNGYMHLDAGLGDGSLGFSEAPFLDYRLGGLWRFHSKWTALGSVGFGEDNQSNTVFSGKIEGYYTFRNAPEHKFTLSAGGGVRWEEDGGNVALMRVISGWQAPAWRFDSNVVLEKASSPDRDPIDLIITMGWLHRVNRMMSAGVELVGQDLEGFWEPNEAEGGARILLGPSVHVFNGQWEAGVAGGYVFWATNSGQTSPADRPFGSSRWALQVSFGRSF